MKPYTAEDIFAYAKWLTQECQAAGLNAEQYGAEILIHGVSNHLSERIICRPDAQDHLRWHWSWGVPIGRLNDSARLLAVGIAAPPAYNPDDRDESHARPNASHPEPSTQRRIRLLCVDTPERDGTTRQKICRARRHLR